MCAFPFSPCMTVVSWCFQSSHEWFGAPGVTTGLCLCEHRQGGTSLKSYWSWSDHDRNLSFPLTIKSRLKVLASWHVSITTTSTTCQARSRCIDGFFEFEFPPTCHNSCSSWIHPIYILHFTSTKQNQEHQKRHRNQHSHTRPDSGPVPR